MPALNYWSEQRGVIKVGGSSVPQNAQASHILLENLEIRSARPPYGFVDDTGSPQSYPNNAAAIFVESGEHITIRNCVLHNCGNGLFAKAPFSSITTPSSPPASDAPPGCGSPQTTKKPTAGTTSSS